MSNNGLPNRKFSQTFFLAEQINGYYVLNDIFRYLKDDDDIEEGDEYDYAEDVVAEVVEAVEEAKEEILEELQDMSIKETSIVEVETEDGEKFKVEESVTLEPISEPPTEELSAAVNGSAEPINVPEEAAPEPEEVVEDSTPATLVEEEKAVEEPIILPVAEEKPASAPVPIKEAPPAPAPAPVPARPKTWATVASSGTVFTATKPVASVTQAPTTNAAPSTAPAAQTPAPVTAAPVAPSTLVTPTTPSGGSAWQTADSKRHPRGNAAPAGQTQAYVKGITEAISDKALKDALTKYGNLKLFEVNRLKV